MDADTAGPALPGGLIGPVLVLADAEAIGRLAPSWAKAFAAAELRYRVRLVSGAEGGGREVDALAGELSRHGARSCVAAGAPGAVATARGVAMRAGVPCIVLESGVAGAATD